MRDLFFVFCLIFLCSCEDYVNSGIEGQWQLRTVRYPDNTEEPIDSVFYSFKKNVFRYLNKINEDSVVICFGNYKIEGKELNIDIKTEIDKFPEKWPDFKRTYFIDNYDNSNMRLIYNDTIYIYRKY